MRISLCTTVVNNKAHNSADNRPFYPADNHYSSHDVYWREGEPQPEKITHLYHSILTDQQIPEGRGDLCWLTDASNLIRITKKEYKDNKCVHT